MLASGIIVIICAINALKKDISKSEYLINVIAFTKEIIHNIGINIINISIILSTNIPHNIAPIHA